MITVLLGLDRQLLNGDGTSYSIIPAEGDDSVHCVGTASSKCCHFNDRQMFPLFHTYGYNNSKTSAYNQQ